MSTAVIHAFDGDHEGCGADDGCGVGSEAWSTASFAAAGVHELGSGAWSPFDPDVWDEETGSTSSVDWPSYLADSLRRCADTEGRRRLHSSVTDTRSNMTHDTRSATVRSQHSSRIRNWRF